MSKLSTTAPPAAGGRRVRRPTPCRWPAPRRVHTARAGPVLRAPVLAGVRIAGAGVPEAGTVAREARFGPYEYVIASLEGPVRAPVEIWSQSSKLCVVALPKFFTPAQSTTSHVKPPPVRVRHGSPRARRVEVAPERREHVVRPRRVREVLRREHDVAAVAAAEHEVAVRDDADPRVGLAAVVERRHIEVRDRVVTDACDRPDSEERQRQVAAVGADRMW